MAELEYIHLMKFMGDYYNAGMNSFLSQLYAYYILFELGEDMTFEMSAFEEYVVDCVKTGEINKPKDKEVLQNTIEVNRGVVNINFEKYEIYFYFQLYCSYFY